MQILFVTYFRLFVFHLQLDVVGPLLSNASLLLVLTTDYSDWPMQDTELIDNWQWRSLLGFNDCTSVWLNSFVKCRETFDFVMFAFTVGTAGLRNFFLR